MSSLDDTTRTEAGRCKAVTVAGHRCRISATVAGLVCARHYRHIVHERPECHPPELVSKVKREWRRQLRAEAIRQKREQEVAEMAAEMAADELTVIEGGGGR